MTDEIGPTNFHHGEAGPTHPSLFSDAPAAQSQPIADSTPRLTGDPDPLTPEDGVTFASNTAAAPNPPAVDRRARHDDFANKAVIGVVGTGIVLRKVIQVVVILVFLAVFIFFAVTFIHGMSSANNVN